MIQKKYIEIVNNPSNYVKNETIYCQLINEVLAESRYLFSKLTIHQRNYINNKYGFIEENCTVQNENDVALLAMFSPNLLSNNEERLVNLIERYFDIRAVMIKPLFNVIPTKNTQVDVKAPSVIVPVKSFVSEDSFKLVIEENDTNFGHVDLIWKGDVSFPPRKVNDIFTRYNTVGSSGPSKTSGSSSSYYGSSGGFYKSFGGSDGSSSSLPSSVPSTISEPYFDKKQEIERVLKNKELKPEQNQKKYFKLFRYGINKLDKPNDNNEPTLSISLFMPNSVLIKRNFSGWTQKYFQNQIKLCLVFNYYFPNGNYRNYFDYYMLKSFESLSGIDESLIITKKIDKFEYNDFEEDKGLQVSTFLQNFYDELKKYEANPFKSGLERFIFTFDLACRCYNNMGKLEFRKKTGDFFVYKFSGPFIENEGKPDEGHITDAYMGQHVRYISLKQKDYDYNETTVKKPWHLVWRDAHTNCIGYNDYLWINELNKNKQKTVYLLPNSVGYASSWHDYANCTVNDQKYKRSAIAGVVQMINPKFSEDDELYIKTIGMAFIINDDKLPLKETRPYQLYYDNKKIITDYQYGIDEYILTSLFIEDKIKKYSIYFNNKLSWEMYKFWVSYKWNKDFHYFLQTAYVFILNKLGVSKIKIIDAIREVEKLRVNNGDKALGFLLSMIPNKYQFNQTIFDYTDYIITKADTNLLIELDVDKITRDYAENDEGIIQKLKNINFQNLNFFGIKCIDNVIINSNLEWCQSGYINNSLKNNETCMPANFYSGFYDESPPSLDIGILRQPSDLKYAIEALEKNNLRLRLNISDYKLNVESPIFADAVRKNIDNGVNHIKPTLQNIILKFGEPEEAALKGLITQGEVIAGKAAGLLTELKSFGTKTHSSVLVPLIWKSLNKSGYDVPPEWFKANFEEKTKDFNKLVSELSSIPGWADYAVEVLISDVDSYDKKDNEFESPKVIAKSDAYRESYKGKDFKKYKMASYIKYLKYKNKYLKLKNHH